MIQYNSVKQTNIPQLSPVRKTRKVTVETLEIIRIRH